ncbi:MAG: hypothetical protein JW940_24595 [Polyangiaceae bacterium]|nr:hypothetical protein [Polyangiaceae bacterium]
MKHASASSLIGVLLATAAFAGIAAADVAPPEDYVETCTLEQQQKPGEECVACQATYFDNPNPCQEKYDPLGYSQRCSSWGTSHTEIWCKGSTAGTGGSAGAGSEEPQAGASNARPDPFAPTGGASSDPPSNTGGTGSDPPSNTGGTSAEPTSSSAGSSTAQPTGTGATPSTSDHEDEGGCSLAAPGRTRSGLLAGLGVLLGLLGARRRRSR